MACLALQRCLQPGSKLAACRWVPETALPELFGFDRASFNNTRVHRALDQFEQAIPSLMAALPRLYQQHDKSTKALYIDVADTWFAGDGPGIAQTAKIKEGMVRRKIGIVLMCNDQNYPLRWEVLEGRSSDSTAMLNMLGEVARLDWLRAVPVVMDRAMGQTAHIRDLLALNVDFVTALTRSEFDSYAPGLPCNALAKLDVDSVPDDAQAACRAADCVRRAGLTQRADNQWVLELGVVEHSERDDELLEPAAVQAQDPLARAMGLARQLKLAVDQQHCSSNAAARALGTGLSLARKYRRLLKLSDSVQRELLDGKGQARSLGELLSIADMPQEQQREAFAQLVARLKRARCAPDRVRPVEPPAEAAPVKVRAVACFNPQMFVEQRRGASRKLARIAQLVANLGSRVNSHPGRYSAQRICTHIDRILQKESMLEAYEARVQPRQNGYDIGLKLHESVWSRRRQRDGWSVIVAHPRLSVAEGDKGCTAIQLCELYRAKDAIEKDFQPIKSFLQLRPVRHHEEDKVRAHVAICVLAPLLERTLHNDLAVAGADVSAAAALELLEPCRLNRFPGHNGGLPAYLLTQANEQQRRVLGSLRLRHLADDAFAMERLSKAC